MAELIVSPHIRSYVAECGKLCVKFPANSGKPMILEVVGLKYFEEYKKSEADKDEDFIAWLADELK